MADYISNYTGAQIDNAIGIGLSKGAANGIASLNASGKVPSAQLPDMNFAPAGYGFGEAIQSVLSTSASESYDTFCAKIDAKILNWGNDTTGILNIYPPQLYGEGSQVCVVHKANANYVTIYSVGNHDKTFCGWRMFKQAGVWQPFEWVNPPMQIGVEYRTTGRYLGKPVYTQIINCGSMPAIGSEKTNSIAAFNVDVVTFISGWCTHYGALIDPNIFGIALSANTDNIRIENIKREVNSNAVMYTLVKYTKTTD